MGNQLSETMKINHSNNLWPNSGPATVERHGRLSAPTFQKRQTCSLANMDPRRWPEHGVTGQIKGSGMLVRLAARYERQRGDRNAIFQKLSGFITTRFAID